MRALVLAWFCGLALGNAAQGQALETASSSKATILPGLSVVRVPDVLYAQVPQLQPGQGLIVDEIASGSLAAQFDLKRLDVLLSYDGQPVRDRDQFNKLVLATKLDQKAPLVLLRGGKEVTFRVALNTTELATNNVKGAIKPGGPPAVAIECTSLDNGKLQVVLGYYPEKSAKLQTVICTGSLMEIEQQVRDQMLPTKIQELAEVAIKRLRTAK
jgi:membrane-associated protease RseP (regulator of RpoE activity)